MSAPRRHLDPHFLGAGAGRLDDAPPPFPRRGGGGGGAAHLLDERIAVQHQEIQTLLVDNQHLAATHVALKQELAAVHHDLHHTARAVAGLHTEADARGRDMHEKFVRVEAEARVGEGLRAELAQTREDARRLEAERVEVTARIQGLTHDVARATADAQQAVQVKQQIEAMKREIQHARACIEHEKKGYADNYEQGQEMQKNLVSMAREVEKLRAEVANAEKRARAAAAAGNPAPSYGGSYGNAGPDSSYGGNPYPVGYGMNPVPGAGAGVGAGAGLADAVPQYGSGTGSGPAQNPWGVYDMQRVAGRR